MEKGIFFREKQQFLLNTLQQVIERFTAEISANTLSSVADIDLISKVQQHQSIIQQIHQELLDNSLHENELSSQFEALFEYAPVPYLLLDSELQIIAANQATCHTLKASNDEISGKALAAFVAEEHTGLLTSFFNKYPHHASDSLLLKMVARDGISFFSNMYCNRIEQRENTWLYLIILLNMETFKQKEQALLEEKLLLQQENSEMEKFMYSASHDLRSPMVSIMGVINVARMETQDEQMIVYLNFIEMSVRKLDNFVQDLINLSKNSATGIQFESIKLQDLINSIFDQLQYIENAKHIRKAIEVQDKAELHSDKERLSIILSNLLSNAIKYHRIGQEDPFIDISIVVNEQQAIILLKDNGQGIAAEHLDKIFNKFYRASQNSKGSGLGLFIVKETLEKLGGSIQAHSTVGKGTAFTIILPNHFSQK